MENSVNNNVNNNGTITTSGASVVNPTPVNPTPVNTTAINNATGVVQPSVNSSSANSTVGTVNTTQKNGKNNTYVYLSIGVVVALVLVVAIILLVLLVTGAIGNRNRLTCTKTITENGYTHVAAKYYKFDGNVYTQVNNVDTFTYTNLTDDVYNQTYDKIINNESNGVTSFGFGTQISREGNVVKITSYNPNFFGKTYDDVKGEDEGNGFTCE